MEFRSPNVAKEQNSEAVEYFTKNLNDKDLSKTKLEEVMRDLGDCVRSFPDWHPIIRAPQKGIKSNASFIANSDVYAGTDHTRNFVRGFITCPYSEDSANKLVENVNQIQGLHASRLFFPLYTDDAYPVVVEALEVELEGDGTIRSRDAIRWFAEQTIGEAAKAELAETWWNIRSGILGTPHGSRSSLFVNQHTGVHMRKILEALNNSEVFGPIREWSLDMLTRKKRDQVSENLLRAAIKNWDKKSKIFDFELRGEICKARVRDTWEDDFEISIRVEIGNDDLVATGFYYPAKGSFSNPDPKGRLELAKKFL